MNIVLFSNYEINQPLSINDTRAEHILKILHKKEGDSFDAGIINGQAGNAQIESITNTHLYFTFNPLSDGKPLYPICLIIGFPRPIQLKRLFRDVAGLGVSKVCLCGTELGEKSYMSSSIVEKGAAYSALLDGTAQAKSTHIPTLELYSSVKEYFEKSSFDCNNNSIYTMLDNVRPQTTLYNYLETKKEMLKNSSLDLQHSFNKSDTLNKSLIQNDDYIYAAIGSERGWTDNERALFKQAGFTSCSIGTRVLRTETAATVATTIILQALEVL